MQSFDMAPSCQITRDSWRSSRNAFARPRKFVRFADGALFGAEFLFVRLALIVFAIAIVLPLGGGIVVLDGVAQAVAGIFSAEREGGLLDVTLAHGALHFPFELRRDGRNDFE